MMGLSHSIHGNRADWIFDEGVQEHHERSCVYETALQEEWMMAEQRGEIVIYKAGDGQTAIDVRLQDETVWLNLNQIATLFHRDKSVISRHLNNIFISKELRRSSVVAKNATTATDGKIYQVEYFNLDAIISIGYRVNSKRGTQFRIWATNVLREHLDKGFTLRFPTVYSASTFALLELPRWHSNTLDLHPGYS